MEAPSSDLHAAYYGFLCESDGMPPVAPLAQQGLFDFGGFDALAPDLDLVVNPAKIVDPAIRAHPHRTRAKVWPC